MTKHNAERAPRSTRANIDTVKFGLPGAEEIDTYSSRGDQLRIEKVPDTHEELSKKIQEMLRDNQTIHEETGLALDQEQNPEQSDIENLVEFLLRITGDIYFVDYYTISDEGIPNDKNLYFVVSDKTLAQLQDEIDMEGLEQTEVPEIGTEVNYGPIRMFFIYDNAANQEVEI